VKIFINTAGTSRDQDYAWYEVADNRDTLRCKAPEIVTRARKLLPIDLEAFGVLLVGDKKSQQVLLTSIPSSARQDCLGRTIRTSLLMEADPSEYKLDQLLIHAFGAFDEFSDQVDQCIEDKTSEPSFRLGDIIQLLAEPPSVDALSSPVADPIKRALDEFNQTIHRPDFYGHEIAMSLSRSFNESGNIDIKHKITDLNEAEKNKNPWTRPLHTGRIFPDSISVPLNDFVCKITR